MTPSPRFERALVFASELHRTQKRKQTRIPYVSHLLAVASLVLEHGGTEDEAIAALLHDAIEDQGGDRARRAIRRRFGQKVVDIVDGCTDAEVIPKPPWKERKEAYVRHLEGASKSIRLVSAADKLHNARSILADYRLHGDRVWRRFTKGKEHQLWYYQALLKAFTAHGRTPLVDELERVVSALVRETGGPDDSRRE
jgi:(p)ppGpp synthase/HD superfamily hydrolase